MARIVAAVASLVLLLAVLAAPVAAAAGHHRALPFAMQLVGADRPLDMSPGFPFEGSTFGGRCSTASTWVTTIDSTGTAGHLGAVSVTQSHCTIFDVLAPDSTHRPFADGRMVVTAANGDELWIHYSGWFLFTPSSETAGVSDIHYLAMDVVGGTGRFDGATGSLVGRATDDFPAGPNASSFRGMLVYDASAGAHR